MRTLTVSLIQTDIHWHDINANLSMFSEKIRSIDSVTDLIVLPEMFSTGFTMETALAEPVDGKAHQWMAKMASETQAVITGSLMVRIDDQVFNRLIWMEPDGAYDTYDKRHLFRMAKEDNYYQSGRNKLIRNYKGWKIFPLICYDLRFPVWSRNRKVGNGMEYDLCLFVANWPAVRSSAWDILIPARAVENLAYCMGVNRVGKDGNDIDYIGNSMVCDPKGNILYKKEKVEDIRTISLEKDSLDEYRQKFPAYLDADDFEIKGS